jgi:PGF-pre-PGF domain-containing protein
MSSFSPGDIGGNSSIAANVQVALYKSNLTCDVPNPSSSCVIADSATMDQSQVDAFNPLSAVIGGGKLSFRMGLLSSGIIVEYVNVDMLASGPPDALFDDSANESTSGDFSAAMRFGSNGPTIYDYVMISMPYTEGNSSQTGLNESAGVNMSLPLFYDESWNVIWNTSTNGTNATLLAGNYSHYSEHPSEWQTLMDNNTCVTNQSEFNVTNPCYINTTTNRIWVRLPHFSGTSPTITGNVITATPSSEDTTTSSSSSSSSSGNSNSILKKVHSWTQILPGAVATMSSFKSEIGIKEIRIQVKNKTQNVKVTVEKYEDKPTEVSVEKPGKVNQYLHIITENLNEILDNVTIEFRVNKSWASENNVSKENIVVSKFNESEEVWKELETIYSSEDDNYFYYNVTLNSFSYFAISEKSLVEEGAQGNETANLPEGSTGSATEGDEATGDQSNLTWLWIIIAVVVIFILSWIGYKKF